MSTMRTTGHHVVLVRDNAGEVVHTYEVVDFDDVTPLNESELFDLAISAAKRTHPQEDLAAVLRRRKSSSACGSRAYRRVPKRRGSPLRARLMRPWNRTNLGSSDTKSTGTYGGMVTITSGGPPSRPGSRSDHCLSRRSGSLARSPKQSVAAASTAHRPARSQPTWFPSLAGCLRVRHRPNAKPHGLPRDAPPMCHSGAPGRRLTGDVRCATKGVARRPPRSPLADLRDVGTGRFLPDGAGVGG
jgi:hypothetical protein